jgi:hypothetical protein
LLVGLLYLVLFARIVLTGPGTADLDAPIGALGTGAAVSEART